MKQLWILLLCCFHLSAFGDDPAIRAAIDFGSGAVKIQMAVVDTVEKRIIGKPLFAKYVPLGLMEDVAAHDGFISEEMQQKALTILQGFEKEALAVAGDAGYQSVQFSGIATAVFRKAKNGEELLNIFKKQLGIAFQILPQDEEGKLGLMTAQALYPEVSNASLLAWDSGNGSFQMTIKEGDSYEVYQGPLGQGTVRVILSKDIRKGPVLQALESGNPVFDNEAIALTEHIIALLPPTPEWLQKKLGEDSLVIATFGDGESIFAITAQAVASLEGKTEPINEAILTLTDVQRVVDAYLEMGDEVFNTKRLHIKTVTCAIHLSAIMRHFKIDKIHYKRSIGNTPGMLISPSLWN